MMQRDRTMLILCVALIAFGVVYYLDPPMPKYYPVVNQWSVQGDLKGPAMGWYGRSGAGFAAAATVSLLLSLLLRKNEQQHMDESAHSIPVWLAYGLAAVTASVLAVLMVAIVLHASQEWGLWGPLNG